MHTQTKVAQWETDSSHQQMSHILVAGLWASDKHQFIRHVCDTPLKYVDIVSGMIPVELPKLLMGEIQVDSRLKNRIWGAPDNWRHDYVNYLVNIKNILHELGAHHRVMGMVVVVDSLDTIYSEDEGKLVRLIQADWSLPYIIVASHPNDPHARSTDTIRTHYRINDEVPIHSYDISQASQSKRALIELMYQVM